MRWSRLSGIFGRGVLGSGDGGRLLSRLGGGRTSASTIRIALAGVTPRRSMPNSCNQFCTRRGKVFRQAPLGQSVWAAARMHGFRRAAACSSAVTCSGTVSASSAFMHQGRDKTLRHLLVTIGQHQQRFVNRNGLADIDQNGLHAAIGRRFDLKRALSVSTSNSTSDFLTSSPTWTSIVTIVPSSIVCPNLGIRTTRCRAGCFGGLGRRRRVHFCRRFARVGFGRRSCRFS